MACPAAEELSRWAIGEPDVPGSEDIERHVLTCARCVETLRVIPKREDRLSRAFEVAAVPLSAEQRASVAAVVERLRESRGSGSGEEYSGRSPGASASVELRAGETSRTVPGPSGPSQSQPVVAPARGKEKLGPGTVLGAYKILKKLGQGGMGVVFLAEHQRMQRRVALKVLPPSAMRNHTAVERFHREVKALGSLSHPNIITAHDADEAGGLHFFVMEYVEGEDLAALVKRRGALPVAQALNYLVQAARALEYAHGKKLVHRDIKPSNLLVDADGKVKLLDLGLARFTEQAKEGDQDLTGVGVMGTPDYMAPEQAERTKSADARSDIYSLGATLFYLLTGRAVYGGESVLERVLAHINQPIPSLREANGEVSAALDRVFRKMVSKKPEQRYQTVGELLRELKPLMSHPADGEEAFVRPDAPRPADDQATLVVPSLAASGVALVRRSWNRRTLVAAAGAAAVLLFGVWLVFRDRDGNEVARVEVEKGGELKFKASPEASVSVVVAPDEAREGTAAPLQWPFSEAEAQRGQQAWAKSLGQPVVEKNSVGMEMVLIPPGTFTMGSPEGEQGHQADEHQVDVTLTRAFRLARTEVTVGQFRRFVEASGYKTEAERNGKGGTGFSQVTGLFEQKREYTWKSTGFTQTDEHPVVYLGWGDAKAYCDWLSAEEHRVYRLPTEAEWEWCCRAGTRTAFSCGDDPEGLATVGNVVDATAKQSFSNWSAIRANDGFVFTAPVGQFRANGFGLCDLHGNVWEWCEDMYAEKLPGGHDPITTHGPMFRVRRGGSWIALPDACRAADRRNLDALKLYDSMGFRPVSLISAKPSTPLTVANGRTAGERLVVKTNGIDLPLRWCPPGTFTMGSPREEPDWQADETQVSVTLTKGFWMAETEVTQELYENVMGKNPSEFPGPHGPVERVSWEEAVKFCTKLTVRERSAGRLSATAEYRLPTEGEWEYACRGGTTTATAFGNSLSGTQANFDGGIPYNGAAIGPYLKKPSDVGRFPANAWGLRDMHGNVWEWCGDWYVDKLKGGADPIVNTGPGEEHRVLRGGGWHGHGTMCRSAERLWYVPDHRAGGVGFRCVRTESSDDPSPQQSALPAAKPQTSGTPIAIEPRAAGERLVIKTNGIDLPLRWCPPGSFRMGSPRNEPGHKDEENQVRVTISTGFWMAETEVTQEFYESVMGANPSNFKGLESPVEQVTWYEAVEFCRKLTERERGVSALARTEEYRLPTEAEWEYACRAMTTTATAFGDKLLSEHARFDWEAIENGGKAPLAKVGPFEVGQFPGNMWGLRDMHGNVWEWCEDAFVDRHAGGKDPLGQPPGDGRRLVRGGGWGSTPNSCRSSYRGRNTPETRFWDLGFRLVRSPNRGFGE